MMTTPQDRLRNDMAIADADIVAVAKYQDALLRQQDRLTNSDDRNIRALRLGTSYKAMMTWTNDTSARLVAWIESARLALDADPKTIKNCRARFSRLHRFNVEPLRLLTDLFTTRERHIFEQKQRHDDLIIEHRRLEARRDFLLNGLREIRTTEWDALDDSDKH